MLMKADGLNSGQSKEPTKSGKLPVGASLTDPITARSADRIKLQEQYYTKAEVACL